jgi:hypothetical protein
MVALTEQAIHRIMLTGLLVCAVYFHSICWPPIVSVYSSVLRFLFHILLTVYFSARNCIVIICYPDKLINA